MNNRKDKLKVKAGVILVVWLMVAVSVSSVYGGVVTNNDDQTSTTDSNLIIDYDDAWIGGLTNLSLEGTNANRWLNDSSDNIYTKIVNSTGGYWDATGSNIQTAIDSDLTGWVKLPPGTFEVTSLSINNTNGFRFLGSGKNNTILNFTANTNTMMLYLHNSHNIEISGIQFNFNNASQTRPDTNNDSTSNLSAIYLSGFCSFITIRDCSFYNSMGSHISDAWYNPSNNVTVENNDFHGREKAYWGGAIASAGHDWIIRNNFIEDTWAVGIRVHGQSGQATRGIDSPSRNLVDGNIITGEIGHGIHVELSNNVTIVNNIINILNSSAYFGFDSATAYSSGIVIGTASSGCIVANNRIDGFNYWGIAVSHNTTINSNTISNGENTLSIGINVASDCLVVSNKLKGIPGQSIKIGGNRNIVSNNMISGGYWGITTSDNYNNIISDNIIHDMTDYGVYIVRSDVSIIGNSFYNIDNSAIYSSGGGIYNNNDIYSITATYAIDVQQTSSYLMNISVCHNEINDTSSVGIRVSCQTEGYNLTSATISYNIINEVGTDGIQITRLIHASVMGNVITDGSGANQAIEVKGKIYDSVFSGNICAGFSDGIKETAPCAYNIYLGNNARRCSTNYTFVGTGNLNGFNL